MHMVNIYIGSVVVSHEMWTRPSVYWTSLILSSFESEKKLGEFSNLWEKLRWLVIGTSPMLHSDSDSSSCTTQYSPKTLSSPKSSSSLGVRSILLKNISSLATCS